MWKCRDKSAPIAVIIAAFLWFCGWPWFASFSVSSTGCCESFHRLTQCSSGRIALDSFWILRRSLDWSRHRQWHRPPTTRTHVPHPWVNLRRALNPAASPHRSSLPKSPLSANKILYKKKLTWFLESYNAEFWRIISPLFSIFFSQRTRLIFILGLQALYHLPFTFSKACYFSVSLACILCSPFFQTTNENSSSGFAVRWLARGKPRRRKDGGSNSELFVGKNPW